MMMRMNMRTTYPPMAMHKIAARGRPVSSVGVAFVAGFYLEYMKGKL